jgi:hemin uptake protein HemP
MADSNTPASSGTPLSPGPSRTQPAATAVAGSVARLDSRTLFSGAQEVEIVHNGAVYRLRQTSLGKLILTK